LSDIVSSIVSSPAQVFIDGNFIGGSDILMTMHQEGELKEMLQPEQK